MAQTTPTKRTRGRPKASEGPVITRKELLEIAAKMIGERGFDGTSIRALAKAAGVTYGTIQNHFPSKGLLWEALVDEVLAPSHESVKPQKEGVVQAIKQEVRSRVAVALTRSLSGAMMVDSSEEGRMRIRYLAQATSGLKETNTNALKELAEDGQIRPIDPKVVGAMFGVALPCLASSRVALQELLGLDMEQEDVRERVVDHLSDLLLYGLLPRE